MHGLTFRGITESRNGWSWKGPVEVILSNLPAQVGLPRAGCPGPSALLLWFLVGSTGAYSTCARQISLHRHAFCYITIYIDEERE